tara:strand:- start:559 stop:861 length:303 start_codon:yes stop_codon:yes gene_type:complete
MEDITKRKLDYIIDELSLKINILKNKINNAKLTPTKIVDIINILDDFDKKYMDDIIYKIDTNSSVIDDSAEERIKEYELAKKSIKPFLPSIILNSMLLRH